MFLVAVFLEALKYWKWHTMCKSFPHLCTTKASDLISEWTFRAQLCISGKFCSLHTPLCSIFSFESSKLILNRPLNLDIESRIDIAISKFAQNWEQILSFQENYKTFNSTFLFNVENLIFLGTSKSPFNYAVYLYPCISLFVENIKLLTIPSASLSATWRWPSLCPQWGWRTCPCQTRSPRRPGSCRTAHGKG